ncbi:MAG: OmpA family protein [Bacteroidia bacterium]|nr:OmpA family protein [Bacteroidia bacterium]
MHKLCLTLLFLLVMGALPAQTLQIAGKIYFPFRESITDSTSPLDRLAQQVPPSAVWSLTGFTDSVGTTESNLLLAGQRNDFVRQKLMEMGWDSQQIRAEARGEGAPLGNNQNEGGRRLNRRVDLVATWQKSPVWNEARKGFLYEFQAETGLEFQDSSGLGFWIEPNSLVDGEGKPLKGWVSLYFRNYADQIDQLEAGISLDFWERGKWYVYHSEGMFDLNATQHGKPVFVAEGKSVRVNYPLDSVPEGLKFYEFIGVEQRWRPLEKEEKFIPERGEDLQVMGSELNEHSHIFPQPLQEKEKSDSPVLPPDSKSISLNPDNPQTVSDPKQNPKEDPNPDDPDSLSGKKWACPGCGGRCNDFFANQMASTLLNSSGEFPDPKQIDLNLVYTLFRNPENTPRICCHNLIYTPEIRRLGGGRGQFISFWPLPQGSQEENANLSPWWFKYPAALTRPKWATDTLSALSFKKQGSRVLLTFRLRDAGTTKKVRLKWMGSGAGIYSPKNRKKGLKTEWDRYLEYFDHNQGAIGRNLFELWDYLRCISGEDEIPTDLKGLLGFMKRNRKDLGKCLAILSKCTPKCDCPPVTKRGPGDLPPPPPPPPPPRDSFVAGDFRKHEITLSKERIVDPLVLIPKFGRYNYDVLSYLPNPRPINPVFVSSLGGSPDFDPQDSYLTAWMLIKDLQGAIRIGNPTVFNVSDLPWHLVIFDLKGNVFYCEAETVQKALDKYPLRPVIPLTKIPHRFGDPPADLRKILTFR